MVKAGAHVQHKTIWQKLAFYIFLFIYLQIPDNSRFLVGQYVTIHDDVISHVNISNVKEEDGGEYMCTAQNAIGK